MLIKVSIVYRTNTTSGATQLKPRRGRGDPRGREKHWVFADLRRGMVVFRWRNQARGEGGWLVCGRPLVQAWKVHRRRAATKPRVAFIKMLNPDLPLPLLFPPACPDLRFSSAPATGRNQFGPPSRRDITASHPWIYAPLRASCVPLPFLWISISFELCRGTYNILNNASKLLTYWIENIKLKLRKWKLSSLLKYACIIILNLTSFYLWRISFFELTSYLSRFKIHFSRYAILFYCTICLIMIAWFYLSD